MLSLDRAGFFSELSTDEQLAYMHRVEKHLTTLPDYPAFMDKLSKIIDEAVAKQADEASAFFAAGTTTSRLDRILHCTGRLCFEQIVVIVRTQARNDGCYSATGVASFLEKAPDVSPAENMERLKILRNVVLPPILRRQV
jgi:hypothetical protein